MFGDVVWIALLFARPWGRRRMTTFSFFMVSILLLALLFWCFCLLHPDAAFCNLETASLSVVCTSFLRVSANLFEQRRVWSHCLAYRSLQSSWAATLPMTPWWRRDTSSGSNSCTTSHPSGVCLGPTQPASFSQVLFSSLFCIISWKPFSSPIEGFRPPGTQSPW